MLTNRNICCQCLFDAVKEDFEKRRVAENRTPKEYLEKRKVIERMSDKELDRELKKRRRNRVR